MVFARIKKALNAQTKAGVKVSLIPRVPAFSQYGNVMLKSLSLRRVRKRKANHCEIDVRAFLCINLQFAQSGCSVFSPFSSLFRVITKMEKATPYVLSSFGTYLSFFI